MIPLFVLPFTLLVELCQRQSVNGTLCRQPPHQDLRQAGTAGYRFARDD
jgi:hypothetical protein